MRNTETQGEQPCCEEGGRDPENRHGNLCRGDGGQTAAVELTGPGTPSPVCRGEAKAKGLGAARGDGHGARGDADLGGRGDCGASIKVVDLGRWECGGGWGQCGDADAGNGTTMGTMLSWTRWSWHDCGDRAGGAGELEDVWIFLKQLTLQI